MNLLSEILSSIQNGHLPPREVLVLLTTRLIGYVMIVSACFVKMPQILKIYRNKSAKGVSVASVEMGVVVGLIHNAYCFSTKIPFSSYGEALASTAQTSILLFLVYHYSQVSLKRRLIICSAFAAFVLYTLSGKLNLQFITGAFLMNQAIFVIERSIQLFKTASEGDAGQLSVTTYATVVLRKSIRIVTSLVEGIPATLIFAGLVGFTMNAIAVVQIVYYNRRKFRQKKVE